MLQNNAALVVTLLIFGLLFSVNKSDFVQSEVDVLSYDLSLEPDIKQQSIKGKVLIKFQLPKESNAVTFNVRNLQIESIKGEGITGFTQEKNSVIIQLKNTSSQISEVIISYHGKPTQGLFFNTDLDEAYTVFSTNQWMPCNMAPADKATFNLSLLIPNNKTCVASGELQKMLNQDGKTLYSWKQHYESPAYTYGFAIGEFNKFTEKKSEITLNYFSKKHSPEELQIIFGKTKNMITFFEEKSGIDYGQPTYSQLIIGDHYQEMSDFSVLKSTYGDLVLKDSTETNLISHELAHQWWGNRITCRSWRHFWLNEAMVTFMSAAYNEHRFGKEKYNADIGSYQRVYEDIKKRGKDKALVFKNWYNPSRDDRNIVYFKGAYVLHLLRQEMGDDAFWKGMKYYTQVNFDKLVVTADFQRAMQRFSKTDLTSFFDKWVYAR